ncbi:hypothetical protein ACFU76_17475 [Streptomyces sp. NPDC057539]|uniref:hypothetical protein n=1 Tax=Streptomyces sp. NPDC057539 TaxID=3346159 RepID=UPI00369515B4
MPDEFTGEALDEAYRKAEIDAGRLGLSSPTTAFLLGAALGTATVCCHHTPPPHAGGWWLFGRRH